MLQLHQPPMNAVAQGQKIKAQIWSARSLQAAESFAEEDRCPALVVPLQVELSDGHLQKALQAASFWIGGFVPDLLQHVMGGVPLLRVEQADGLLELSLIHI